MEFFVQVLRLYYRAKYEREWGERGRGRERSQCIYNFFFLISFYKKKSGNN